MWYTLLMSVVTVLILTFITSYAILRRAVRERELRRLLLFFVIITPFVSAIALMRALVRGSKPVRYSEQLGEIEDQIESERAVVFKDRPIHPSFSYMWRVSYLYALEKSAASVVRLDRRSVSPSLCGVASLRR
ncbi:MAG TPA: hypothetical protein VMB47_05705 [Candidatus Aquilonibacter sp.]|nr:hypothetical protein [Candidatus Aquilonibacter sp.]